MGIEEGKGKELRRGVVIYLVVLGCYVLTAGGHLYSPDEELLFRTTRALATRGSLAIEPIAGPGGTFASRAANPPREDGLEYAQYGVGQPLLAVPFYWIGAGLGRMGSDETWERMTGGHYQGSEMAAADLAPRWALSWFNILLMPLLAVLVMLIACEVGAGETASTLAGLLFGLGSMAWPHSRPFFTEGCATLFIMLGWYCVLRGLRGNLPKWCLAGGAAAGFAALVRLDSALAYPGLAIVMLGPVIAAARERRLPIWIPWGMFAAPALLCGLIILGLNWAHFGSALASGYSDQPEGLAFSSPVIPGLYGLLFSAGKGLFFFSPVLVLSFLGWRPLVQVLDEAPAAAVYERPWAVWWGLFIAVLVPLIAHAKWPNWSGGWCWGPRHVFIIHPFLAIPVAAWLAASWSRASRIAFGAVIVLGMFVQLLGASQDFIKFHQRFFRMTPPEPAYFTTMMDDYDQAYWRQHYALQFRREPLGGFRPVDLGAFPASISSSIFYPSHTVWVGYPIMLQEGTLDNFWVNLVRRAGGESEVQAP